MPEHPLIVDVQVGKESDIGMLSPQDLRLPMATLLIDIGAPSRHEQELAGAVRHPHD